MPTRFYFPEATAADLTPSFDAGWEYVAEALRRKLVREKGASAITVGTQIGPWTATTTTQALDRQYVSPPLKAQTISGTYSGQLMVREYATTDNVDQSQVGIYVCNSAGTKVATLVTLAARGPVLEFISNVTHRNKTLGAGVALTSYSCADGDRIVVEIGYGCSTAPTTPEASAKWGENATDLPVNETQTTDGAGWIEFSGTIGFLHAQSGTGALSFGGAGVDDVVPGGTTYNESGTGAFAFSGAGADGKTYVQSGTGALAFGGTGADGKVYAQGSSGGVVFGGSGRDGKAYTQSAAGQLTFGGSGSDGKAYTQSGAGQLVFAGAGQDSVSSGTTYSETGTGGLVLSGAGVQRMTFAPAASGQLTFGGAGLDGKVYSQSGSGALAFAGSGQSSRILMQTGSGLVAFGGSGADGKAYTQGASGALTFGGAGFDSQASGGVYTEVGAGTLAFGGAGSSTWTTHAFGSGAFVFGGAGITDAPPAPVGVVERAWAYELRPRGRRSVESPRRRS